MRETFFFGHTTSREKMKHLVSRAIAVEKRSGGRRVEKTEGISHWLYSAHVVPRLRVIKQKGVWRTMAHIARDDKIG